MALKTVGNLKDSISGSLTGTNLDNVTNLKGCLERAVRGMIQRAFFPEAVGRKMLTLYDKVFDYAIDQDTFGSQILDLRPQGDSRNSSDFVYKYPGEQFDRTKDLLPSGYKVTQEYRNGVPYLRIASSKPLAKSEIDSMTDDNGWTAAGSASGLTEDNANYYQSPASLRFTLTGASTGTLTKATTQMDISDFEDVGVAFLAIQIPSGASAATLLTSIELRLGSSATAYNNVSTTQGFLGAWTLGEWLLVAFDFAGASQTGTPDWTAIDYTQVRLAHSATITNFRVGGLWIAMPSAHELLYQTAKVFIPNGSTTPQSTISDDNDSIMLSDPAYTILEKEGAIEVVKQMGGSAATPLVVTLHDDLWNKDSGLYTLYRGDNPNQTIRTVGNYYDDEE